MNLPIRGWWMALAVPIFLIMVVFGVSPPIALALTALALWVGSRAAASAARTDETLLGSVIAQVFATRERVTAATVTYLAMVIALLAAGPKMEVPVSNLLSWLAVGIVVLGMIQLAKLARGSTFVRTTFSGLSIGRRAPVPIG